jgi:hypothetical protein
MATIDDQRGNRIALGFCGPGADPPGAFGGRIDICRLGAARPAQQPAPIERKHSPGDEYMDHVPVRGFALQASSTSDSARPGSVASPPRTGRPWDYRRWGRWFPAPCRGRAGWAALAAGSWHRRRPPLDGRSRKIEAGTRRFGNRRFPCVIRGRPAPAPHTGMELQNVGKNSRDRRCAARAVRSASRSGPAGRLSQRSQAVPARHAFGKFPERLGLSLHRGSVTGVPRIAGYRPSVGGSAPQPAATAGAGNVA